MTTINLHGILAKEFGNSFQMKIRKSREVFQAIDVNKNNFIHRILNLAKEGVHYAIIVDGKDIKNCLELEINNSPKTIDIIPAICGAGSSQTWIRVGLGVLGVVALAFGQISLGVALIGMAITMGMKPKPETIKPQTYFTSGTKESFIFSSKANLMQQGSPVPIGYGRLRIGSNVIQTTVKSFPLGESIDSGLTAGGFNSNVHKYISREK